SPDGRVFGTYLHGIFDNDPFRRAFLNAVRREKGIACREAESPAKDPFDALADHLEKHVDVDRILAMCGR
ncbi:MAG TPA: cobyric acid synthase CobQ, partial [Verrucomicrobiae bacterium]|nr:cobyric acid synthase CobQ [Verrucomicrobiae bacterium]